MPEMHQALGSCLSFSTMLSQAWTGIVSIAQTLWYGILAVCKFIFDSIFPPVIQKNTVEGPKPASGLNSDV